MEPEKIFCGLNWEEMNNVLDTLCIFEDDILMTDEEEQAMDIAIQCVVSIMNRMKKGVKVIVI